MLIPTPTSSSDSSWTSTAGVWMIREGDCHIIGRRDGVRLEMWRFLAGTELRGP